MTEATKIIAQLNEDMAASPVDDITTIDRQQLKVLEDALAAALQPDPVLTQVRYQLVSGEWTEWMEDGSILPTNFKGKKEKRKLYAHPPTAAPQLEPAPVKCRNCGSENTSWFAVNKINSMAPDGRLCAREVSCNFVMGCDECSETLRVVSADRIAAQMSSTIPAPGLMEEVKRVLELFTAPGVVSDEIPGRTRYVMDASADDIRAARSLLAKIGGV